MSNNQNTAYLSHCRRYRYALWRTWDNTKPFVLFIGLNPSTADETSDDPTLVRCINFAKDWGYGGVCMANLFAYRATQPQAMKNASDPIGKDNNKWLKKLSKQAGIVIAAWGNDGTYLGRSYEVQPLIAGMHCLKINKSGQPAHPLYQPSAAKPVLMAAKPVLMTA